MLFKGKMRNFGIFLSQLKVLFHPSTKVSEIDLKLNEICGSNAVVDHRPMWKK